MTAPSSSPERAPREARFAWWRVPVLWLLIGLLGSVIAASVATIWIARHAADDEMQAAPGVIHMGPPRAAEQAPAAAGPGAGH